MIVAIHQPNLMPWLGYFHKIAQSDVFVLFDDVQFPRGKSFGNRAAIKTKDGEAWITASIQHKSDSHFNEMLLAPDNWRKKALRTIQLAYSKAPFYATYAPEFTEVWQSEGEKLCGLNVALIRFFVKHLGLQTRLVFSSELCGEAALGGADKIMFILKKLGATAYVSGRGAGSLRYVQEQDFNSAYIELIWQDFAHPVYPQLHGAFIPNLSILDLLFNCGSQSLEILTQKGTLAGPPGPPEE